MKKTGPLSLNDLRFCLAGTRVRVPHSLRISGKHYALQVQDQPDDGWRTVKHYKDLTELFRCPEAAALFAEAAGDTDEPETARKLLECAADINARAEGHKS